MQGSAPTDIHYNIGAVAWSPDGSTIASSNAAALDLWDPATGRVRSSVHLASDELAWSPDSTKLAIGSASTVRVWRIDPEGETGEILKLTSSEMSGGISVNGLTFADGSSVIATGDGPGSAMKVWDVGLEGTEELANVAVPPFFGDVEFAPDGRTFLTAGPDGQATRYGRVAIWDLATKELLGSVGAVVKEHFFDVTDDGDTLAEVDYEERVSPPGTSRRGPDCSAIRHPPGRTA